MVLYDYNGKNDSVVDSKSFSFRYAISRFRQTGYQHTERNGNSFERNRRSYDSIVRYKRRYGISCVNVSIRWNAYDQQRE